MTVPQAKRLRDLPNAALALIESGARGLDAILEDLASDPGLPAAEVDGVGDELDEERFDADFEGRN